MEIKSEDVVEKTNNTSPTKKSSSIENSSGENNNTGKSFGQISFKIDLIATSLFVLAAATRFYNLSYPHNIVFDELHYGKYASLYLKRVFFFDSHPPLGKQLIAASAALFDPAYNGSFRFDRIGSPYPTWVPVFGLRFIPALAGSLVPSFSYILCRELNISIFFSVISGLLMIFDNALLIQSRYILLEMPVIATGILSLVFALKATKRYSYFQRLWFVVLSAFCGTLSLSIKYIGTFYLGISAGILFVHIWTKIVPRKDYSNGQVLRQLGLTYTAFFITFLVTYLSIFYVHLAILTNAGPHDTIMTSAFQASLKGGLASIIKGQPLQVAHGSQVTLRHALGRPCWLHSHPPKYPIKYPDKRGSSHQQQVTCYSFKDVNNWWIVKRPNVDNLGVNETKDVIKNGDEIHFVHGITGRLLNSHDVAAPVSPQNQEVSCYVDYNVSMPAEPLWRVEIIGGCGENSVDGSNNCEWHAVKSTVRLIHVTSGQALKMSGKQLPKWGFHQHEVVTDRIVVQDDTIWNVEEHRYTKSEKDREKELMMAEMIPTKPTVLSFWSKFCELQWKMLVSAGSTQADSHVYSSSPAEWLFMSRGIAYWIALRNNAQIHFLGNPVLWLTASFALFLHVVIIVYYALRQRREVYDISTETWSSLLLQSGVCLGGYLITYIHHFCIDRSPFLYHYLPSYIFKLLLLTSTLDHFHSISSNKKSSMRIWFMPMLICWASFVLYAFGKFSPLSIGQTSLSRSELDALKWRSSWDFIVQS